MSTPYCMECGAVLEPGQGVGDQEQGFFCNSEHQETYQKAHAAATAMGYTQHPTYSRDGEALILGDLAQEVAALLDERKVNEAADLIEQKFIIGCYAYPFQDIAKARPGDAIFLKKDIKGFIVAAYNLGKQRVARFAIVGEFEGEEQNYVYSDGRPVVAYTRAQAELLLKASGPNAKVKELIPGLDSDEKIDVLQVWLDAYAESEDLLSPGGMSYQAIVDFALHLGLDTTKLQAALDHHFNIAMAAVEEMESKDILRECRKDEILAIVHEGDCYHVWLKGATEFFNLYVSKITDEGLIQEDSSGELPYRCIRYETIDKIEAY